jgi:hypothetical protein
VSTDRRWLLEILQAGSSWRTAQRLAKRIRMRIAKSDETIVSFYTMMGQTN